MTVAPMQREKKNARRGLRPWAATAYCGGLSPNARVSLCALQIVTNKAVFILLQNDHFHMPWSWWLLVCKLNANYNKKVKTVYFALPRLFTYNLFLLTHPEACLLFF